MHNLYHEIIRVADGSPKQAISLVVNLVDDAAAHGGVNVSDLYDSLSVADNTYRMMLRAHISGVEDSSSNAELLRKLKSDILDVLRRLSMRAMLANPTSPLLRRMADMASRGPWSSQQWHEAHLALITPGSDDMQQKEFDDMLKAAFDSVALATELRDEQYEGISAIIDDETCSPIARLTLVSALTINSLRYFNAKTFDMLVDIATYHARLRYRAMVGIVFNILCRFDELSLMPHFFSASLPLLMQLDGVRQAVKDVMGWMFICLTAPHLAEELDKSIGSLIRATMKQSQSKKDDADDGDGTPKWIRRVEEVLTSKIEDMVRLASEGYDLHYASFRYQRSMPYWKDEYHWFTPYYKEDPAFSGVLSNADNSFLLDMLRMQQASETHSKSLLLQFVNLPSNIVADIGRQVKEQMSEVENEGLDMTDTDMLQPNERSLELYYVHDLYRFFSLHAEEDGELPKSSQYLVLRGVKSSTANPFDFDLLLRGVDTLRKHVFGDNFDVNDMLITVVLALINGNMKDNAKMVIEQVSTSNADVDTLRQIGYIYEKLSEMSKALGCYEKADAMQHDDQWTNRRLVYCYSKTGDFDMAVTIFERLSDMFLPVDDLLEFAAESYFHLSNFDMCLQCCRRYEQSVPADKKPEPWCYRLEIMSLCAQEKYEEAKPCVENLLADTERPDTLVIAGHHALCLGDTTRAIAFYHKAYAIFDAGVKRRKEIKFAGYDKRTDTGALINFQAIFHITSSSFPAVPSDPAEYQYLIDAAMYGTL